MHLTLPLARFTWMARARIALCFFVSMFIAGVAQAQTLPLPSPNIVVGNGTGEVRAIVPLAAGGMLIGGDFEIVNGLARKGIARINADGTLDAAWNPGFEFGQVRAILVSGSYAYLGGFFLFDGNSRSLLRVALADGSISSSWSADVDFLPNALATDGTDLFVGGRFSTAGGQPRNSLARFDLASGNLGAWTNDVTRDGFSGEIDTLLIDGGYLYLGGHFDTVGGQSRANLARVSLGASNSADATWVADADQPVTSLAKFGPHIYVGGYFNTIAGASRSGLARVSASGGAAVDTDWVPEANSVRALFVDAAGAVAGAFSSSRSGIAEFDLTTGATTAFNPAGDEAVFARTIAPAGGNLFVTGGLDRESSIMKVSRAGVVDFGYRIFAGNGSGQVTAVLHGADGHAYVAGDFQGVNGVAISNLLRLKPDGSLDTDWRPQPSGGHVEGLALSGSALIVGGEFKRMSNVAKPFLAKVDTGTGVLDAAWDPAPNSGVRRLAIDGSHVFVGGYFWQIGGLDRGGLAKLTIAGAGSADPAWTAPEAPTHVYALTVANGHLFVGGGLSLLKLSASSGAADPGWQPGPLVSVNDMVAVGNDLFVAGAFNYVGGLPQAGVAKLAQATGLADPAWMPQIEGQAQAIAHYAGSIVVGSTGRVNGAVDAFDAVAFSAASGRQDMEWRPDENLDVRTVSTRMGEVWLNDASSGALKAFAAPFCAGKPDNTACTAPGYSGATCQASACVVPLATTSVAVSISPTTVVQGNFIHLRATVNSNGAPATGTVRFVSNQGFQLNSDEIEAGVVDTIAYTHEGLTHITAIYDGSAQHLPSRSAAVAVALVENAPIRADFGGDGRSDILWYHTGVGGLIAMDANGTSLGSLYIVDHEPDLNWKVVGTGDLNGDGRADVVWRNTTTGAVYGLLMNGQAVLSEGQIYNEPNLDWKIEQIADLDADGKSDLVWKNQATSEVYVMLMDGLAISSGQVVYVEPNLDWKIAASGDMDGDGRADLLWRNQTTGDVFAMLMDGFDVVEGGVIYSEPNTNWKIVGLADFDGDRRADVLWQNSATGDVFQMRMIGTTVIGGQVIYNEPNTQWKIVSLGDYNGDGRADVLWHNTATGQVYMMLMDGFTIGAGAFVYTEPDTQWRILGP